MRRLKTGEFLRDAQMTDGIEVNEWQHDGVDFYFWDFGGQAVYLNTHPLFFSNRTIFLLVLNPRSHGARELEPYPEAVRNCVPDAPLLVVTTRAAEVAALAPAALDEIGQRFGPLVGAAPHRPAHGRGHGGAAGAAGGGGEGAAACDATAAATAGGAAAAPRRPVQAPAQPLPHAGSRAARPGAGALRHGRGHGAAGAGAAARLVHVLPGGEQVVLAPQQLTDVLACVITAHQQALEVLGAAGSEGLLVHSSRATVWERFVVPRGVASLATPGAQKRARIPHTPS